MSIHKSKTRQPIPHAGREKSRGKMDGLNRIERKKKIKQKKSTHTNTGVAADTPIACLHNNNGTVTCVTNVRRVLMLFSLSHRGLSIYMCVWASLLFGWIVHANLTMFSRAGPTHDTPTHRLRQSFREHLCWQTENNEEEEEEVGCPFCFFPRLKEREKKPCVYRLTARWRPPVYGSIRPILFFFSCCCRLHPPWHRRLTSICFVTHFAFSFFYRHVSTAFVSVSCSACAYRLNRFSFVWSISEDGDN